MRWKATFNAFAIIFNGRFTPTGNKSMPRSDAPLLDTPVDLDVIASGPTEKKGRCLAVDERELIEYR
jgi:hypothetical protein